jgi:hypothetical protein
MSRTLQVVMLMIFVAASEPTTSYCPDDDKDHQMNSNIIITYSSFSSSRDQLG